ncbi:uncharacterized protein BcabD6B2_54960 [Babesia caballi]|uniref:Transmembrane protein, putative n=1 Tax=Babesia caballi TaxID=5871 RepID=A0AAV4M2F8_BABCB|nr:transmembrane protein, putative [Babesia caballi]
MLRLAGRALGRTCCRGVELCVCNHVGRMTAILPTITEYEPIASFLFYTGVHRHRGFHLLIEVCALEGAFVRQKTVLELVVGGMTVPMTAVPTNPKGVIESLGSRGLVYVTQREDQIQLLLYRKHLVTRRRLASLTFNVERDILGGDFPKSKWYTIRENGTALGRAKISFFKSKPNVKFLYASAVEAQQSLVDCLVLQQALMCAQEYKDAGKTIRTDLSVDGIMLEHEKLFLFSFALEGPLIAKESYASEMRYYKAVLTDGAWKWCFWSSKVDCRSGRRPLGAVAILSISTVIRHPTDYSCFYVKYYTKDGAHDVIFKAVDRNRDVWADALFLFIEEARRYLEHFETFEAVEHHCLD